MNIPEVKFRDNTEFKGYGKYFYPSVDCGELSIEKAQKMLDWKPSKLEDALNDTTQFFLTAGKYKKELKIVEKKYSKVNKYYPVIA